MYGFAILMFAYVSSFLFSKHATAQTYTVLICSLGVTILQGVSFALSYPTLDVPQWAQDLFNYVACVLRGGGGCRPFRGGSGAVVLVVVV